jgi:small subunit ribosomal protein S3e
MIKSGQAGQLCTDHAVRHVLLRQGVIGIQVRIFLPQDPNGILGPKIPLDDVVTILDPKEEMSPEAMLAKQQQQFMQQAMAASSAPIMSAMMPDMAAAAGDPMMDPAADAGF